ncbi:MAG: hypothetical protein ACO1QS_15845, partial [Verrucomicrobiota bacterium]
GVAGARSRIFYLIRALATPSPIRFLLRSHPKSSFQSVSLRCDNGGFGVAGEGLVWEAKAG